MSYSLIDTLKNIGLFLIFITMHYYAISNYLMGILAMLSNKFKKAPLFIFIMAICMKNQFIKAMASDGLDYNSVVSRSLSTCTFMNYIMIPTVTLLNKKRTYYEPRVLYTSYVFSFIGILIHLKCLVNQFSTPLFIYTLMCTMVMYIALIYIDLPNAFIPVIGHSSSENNSVAPPLDRTSEQIERSQVAENTYFKQFTDLLFGYTLNLKKKHQLQTIIVHSLLILTVSLVRIAPSITLLAYIYITVGYLISASLFVLLYYKSKYPMPVIYSFVITLVFSIFFQLQIIKTLENFVNTIGINDVMKDLLFYGFAYNFTELVLSLNLINVRETEMAIYLIFISYTLNLLSTPIISQSLSLKFSEVDDLSNYLRVITICFFVVFMFVTAISFEGSRAKLTKELGVSLILTFILYFIILFVQNKYGASYFAKHNRPNNQGGSPVDENDEMVRKHR
ncbi:hypothetical protein CDIK_1443 [Cucumispora dikerogammari]|nr:hypothetical protein CDIK_1443 [Cucumispora dikerogammari]